MKQIEDNRVKEAARDFLPLYKDLLSFIFRLTCNKQDAEDIVQETFISVEKNQNTFLGHSSFKTWVYSIAINKARNHAKVQNRWQTDFQDMGEQTHLNSPALLDKLIATHRNGYDVSFEINEHISYCFTCMTKTLDLPQQVCLWLHDFYHFKVHEIMQITELTEGSVKHNLTYAKKTLDDVFEKRCAFVNKNGVCHQCSALKGILSPNQQAMQQKVEIKRDGQSATNKALVDIRIEMIKDINPLDSPNSHLHIYLLERLPDWQ